MHKLNTTMFDTVNRLDRSSVLKFRCALQSQHPNDVHRSFTGCYFPRWHALYLEEVRLILGEVKMFPVYPMDTYVKINGDHFLVSDFQRGCTIVIDAAPNNQRDTHPRTFVITEVDESRLGLEMLGLTTGSKAQARLGVSDEVGGAIIDVRNAFIKMTGGVPELGIKKFASFFRGVDDDGRRLVTQASLKSAISESGVAFSQTLIDDLFTQITGSAQSNSSFDLESLLEIIRGPMSAERKKAVHEVFRELDFDRDGCITTNEIAAKYAASSHAEVNQGTFTAQQILNGFLASWETTKSGSKISFAEFYDYYSGVSATVADDAHFIAIVRSSWRLR